jgi:hypothetical protein
MIGLFFIGLICSYGLAVALVEKRHDWPVKPIHDAICGFLRPLFNKRIDELLSCTVCTSFWAALFVDLVFGVFTGFKHFFWPLSGFAAMGVTWTIIEFLNILDSSHEIKSLDDEDLEDPEQ